MRPARSPPKTRQPLPGAAAAGEAGRKIHFISLSCYKAGLNNLKMKLSSAVKLTLLFFSFLVTSTSYGQCISLKEMRGFFFKDMEEQDNFMEARNFHVSFSSAGVGIEWTNKKTGTEFTVDYDSEGKVWQTTYRLKASKGCFDLIKNEIATAGLNKDSQFYTNHGELYYYYSNSKYGVEVSKWTAATKQVYYHVSVLSKTEYWDAMKRMKEVQ